MDFRNYVLRNPSFWLLNLAVWVAFGILATLAQFYYYSDPRVALQLALIQILIAFTFSSMMRQVYRRPSWSSPFRVRTAALVVLLGLLGGIVQASLIEALVHWKRWGNPDFSFEVAWLLRIKITWLAYLGWGLGYFGIKAETEALLERDKALKARDEARNMELQMLRSQLDPHFLFNSLNGISAEITPHPNAAIEMIDELASYLRYSLDHRQQVFALLSAELDTMDAYLRVEKARFGDRLKISVKADEKSRRRKVPSFLLQALVENAVKHGLHDSTHSLEIAIHAVSSHELLEIEVANTGTLTHSGHEGVGLSTLRRRLDLHYPNRHSFHLIAEGNLVRAQLVLEGEPCSES
ncbi:MAG: histidine kinase [Chthoniobacterales bacterium]